MSHHLIITRDTQRRRGWYLAWRCTAPGCDTRGDATTPARETALQLLALLRERHDTTPPAPATTETSAPGRSSPPSSPPAGWSDGWHWATTGHISNPPTRKDQQ